MSDSMPHPDRDDAQDAELEALRKEMQEHRDHRTMVRTLMGLASAVALVVVLGAVSVRDTTMATSARVDSITERMGALTSAAHARDADDRGSRETLVRLTTTIEAMRNELADLRAAVLTREAQNHAPRR